jgi:hypothetical protein
MTSYVLRKYAGPQDVERQYELWLRATEGLPFAWRSNLTNVRYVSQHVEQHPRSRIYAERPSGELVGYVGTHPPIEWGGQWVLPFGFPWTVPIDEGLERELYDRMFEATLNEYPGMKRDIYLQRFRSSWKRQLDFVFARRWRQAWRHPIWSRASAQADSQREVTPMSQDELPGLYELVATDPLASDVPSVEALGAHFLHGWSQWGTTWQIPEVGAFSLEVRPPWAEVTFFCVRPAAAEIDMLLSAMLAKASELGAAGAYFSLREDETARMQQLADRGFAEVDADIYVAYELQSQ